jgi:hypothetical protein
MKIKEPKWSVGQLATWELRDYRASLETALLTLPVGSDDYADHERRLKAVTSEQATRRHQSVPTGA